jgi:hypothetical protein
LIRGEQGMGKLFEVNSKYLPFVKGDKGGFPDKARGSLSLEGLI